MATDCFLLAGVGGWPGTCCYFQRGIFRQISGILPRGRDTIPRHGKKYPCRARNTFPDWEKENILYGLMHKIFPFQQWVFPGSGMEYSKAILEFY
jgi:hypothetical protein